MSQPVEADPDAKPSRAGVPSDALEAALDTLGGAVAVAADLPTDVGAELVRAARGAFLVGLRLCAAISVVLSLMLAVFVFTRLRDVARSAQSATEAEG